jgi:hypothetical protein
MGMPLNGIGHGGAATGLAVNTLAHARKNHAEGLGTAIFAAHWAFQHYTPGTQMDRFMWEGKPDLIEYLETDPKNMYNHVNRPDVCCNCDGGTLKNHLREDFRTSPITKFARQYPAGSNSFFHTDYTEAYTKVSPNKYRVHIGQQSVLPTPGERSGAITFAPGSSRGGNPVGTIKALINAGRCTIHIANQDARNTSEGANFEATLKLHTVNIKCERNTEISITYTRLREFPDVSIQLRAKVRNDFKSIDLSGEPTEQNTRTCPIPDSQDCITNLEILVQGKAKDIVDGAANFIDIFKLTIKPSGLKYPTSSIQNVKIIERDDIPATAHKRLVWTVPDSQPVSDLPYSKITRNFSHFVVSAEDGELGRAYATQFVLRPAIYKRWKDKGTKSIKFDIVGYAFDGTELAHFSGPLTLP